jgi:C4-dicarboxylate-specific signal transduction histidine kinase
MASGDVEAAIHDTATLVAHQASMQSLELKLDVYPGLPRVGISTEQLMQVLLNLLLNAADALEGAANGHLSVVAQAESEGVRIQVEDNGPGVDPAHVNAIFDPFFTTKDVGKGTGLGLSVCQGLVEAAHGTLSLDTSTTSGARFVLWLPKPRGSSGDTAANDQTV